MVSQILMIENDPDDRLLTKEVFHKEWPEAVIDFISGVELQSRLENAHYKPQLVLLSTNAQPYRGMELVRQIRASKGYESTPVIVLSESTLPQEVQASYAAGANSFIKKPASYSDTLFKIRSFINYWFQTVELPVYGKA